MLNYGLDNSVEIVEFKMKILKQNKLKKQIMITHLIFKINYSFKNKIIFGNL